MNSVDIIGNLGAQADLRYSPNGTAYCIARMALQTGKEKTAWVDVKAFGPTAELLGKASKGTLVAVSGRLDQESWPDKNTGEKRYKLLVIANSIRLLGGSSGQSASQSNSGQSRQRGGQQGQSRPTQSDDYGSDIGLEDIPF